MVCVAESDGLSDEAPPQILSFRNLNTEVLATGLTDSYQGRWRLW